MEPTLLLQRVAVRPRADVAAAALSPRPEPVPEALLGGFPPGTTLEFTATPAKLASLTRARASTLSPRRREAPTPPVARAPDGSSVKPRADVRVPPPLASARLAGGPAATFTHILQFPEGLPIAEVRSLLERSAWIDDYGTLGLVRGSTASEQFRADGPLGIDVDTLQGRFGDVDVGHHARVGLVELGMPVRIEAPSGNRYVDHDQVRDGIRVRGGQPHADWVRHGLAMLSLLAAKKETVVRRGGLLLGADAIYCRLPGTESNLTSTTTLTPTPQEIAEAITLLAGDVKAGGVICIPLELQVPGGTLPLDAAPEVRDAIEDATRLGVLVVLSAGNQPWPSALPIDMVDVTVYDSGALIVGRGDPTPDSDPKALTLPAMDNDRPTHRRIDCHSWGRAAQALDPDGNSVGASGSSAATMLVGAAAALVQSAHLLVRPSSLPLNPETLRDWLRTHGHLPKWPSGDPAESDQIGVQPDIDDIARAKIFEDPWTDSRVNGDIDAVDDSAGQRPGPGGAPPSPEG